MSVSRILVSSGPGPLDDVGPEVFGEIRPASTMVEVAALIAPELMVEIEADAY
jgi:enamine deaminase RidA (YjgF/YER057c/UK114 family)